MAEQVQNMSCSEEKYIKINQSESRLIRTGCPDDPREGIQPFLFTCNGSDDARIPGALALCCNRTVVTKYLAAVGLWTDVSGHTHSGHVAQLHPKFRPERDEGPPLFSDDGKQGKHGKPLPLNLEVKK
jgi:hypothetical protein